MANFASVEKKGLSNYFPLIIGALDVLALGLAILLATITRFGKIQNQGSGGDYFDFLALAPIIWLLIALQNKLYSLVRIDSIDRQVRKIIYTLLLYFGLMFLVIVVLDFDEISRLWVFYISLYLLILLVTFRTVFHKTIIAYRQKGGNARRVIVVGNDKVSATLYNYLEKNIALGYKVDGYFNPTTAYFKPGVTPNMNFLGEAETILTYIKTNNIDEIFWKVGQDDDELLKELIDYCENNLIRFKLIPYFGVPISGRQPNIDSYLGIPVVTLRKEPLQIPLNNLLKRIFDIIFSLLALIVLTPLIFPWVAIAIKMNSKGPIFFKQLRSGENNMQFWCYKFRTMTVNELSDKLQATKNDARITRVGKFLRKSNFDELPQFFNVLRGEMSVVGPRPHMLKHTEDYSKLVSKFLVRHFAKPGITGWAQVTGHRGETSEVRDMQKRVEADIWYVENWSFVLDIRIIFMTVRNMIVGDENAV